LLRLLSQLLDSGLQALDYSLQHGGSYIERTATRLRLHMGMRSQTSGGNEDLVSMGAGWCRRSMLTSKHFWLHPHERLP
jgi:hypothetical protein